MPRESSWEVRERAEELYIVEGFTYEQVAHRTGVSKAQLQRWAKEGQWAERRREYRQALSDIRRKIVLLRKRLIDNAMETLNPQDVYAVYRAMAVEDRALPANAPHPSPEEREIRTPAEAVAALEEAVQRKPNRRLAGDVSLAGIRDMKKALELIEEMKKRYPASGGTKGGMEGEAAQRGLDAETVRRIREEVYGLSSG